MQKKFIINFENIKTFFKDLKVVFNDNFYSNKVNNESSDFDSLTPTILDEKDIAVYSNALKVALENKDITNIALTGVYGSGKSSIIKTFQYRNPQYDYLNISLAAFKPVENGEKQGVVDDLERLLELSILQQLFYHVKHDIIPDSRFRRIKSLSKWKIGFISFAFVLWSIAYFILFKENLILKMIPESWEFIYFQYVAVVFILLGLGLFASKIIRILNNSKLNKLNVQSGDFELDENVDQSIINKNIDEIIYFFERTPFNIIVIEDLDRFENTEIFSKLREINLLLNNSQQVNKRIVFIYAVRDDLFEDYKHRTKFFDFLIPVIPIINPSNANEKLLEKFNALDSNKKPKEDFINEVSYFINDMRLLKNIWNEYIIYRDNLSNGLVQDKLLAMVIYKNLYPKDFSLLNNNEGELYEIISKRELLIKDKEAELNNLIEAERSKIEIIKKEQIKDESELRAIYVNAVFENVNTALLIEVDGVIRDAQDLVSKDVFEKLKLIPKFRYYTYDNYETKNQSNSYRRIKVSELGFSDIEKKVNANSSFDERVEFLNKETLQKHSNKIDGFKTEIENLRQLTLKQIIKKSNKSSVFGDYLEDRLIVYLLSEGHINEQFSDYTSYFHEVSLTKQDYDFLQSVISDIPNDFNFKLNKIDKLVKKLKDRYFNSNAIFNNSLLDFLLLKQQTYKRKVDLIFDRIKSTAENDFIDNYINNGKQVPKFINVFVKKWYGFWEYVETNPDFSTEKKDKYLILIIENADIKSFWDFSSRLKKYISEKENFLDSICKNTNGDKINLFLNKLDVKLKNVSVPTKENRIVFDFIYDNNNYSINSDTLTTFLEVKSSEKFDTTKALIPSYTNILKSELEKLIVNVNENIDEYVESVLLEMESLDEDETSFIKLLNNSKLNEDLKVKLIDKTTLKIENLGDIDSSNIKEYLLGELNIQDNWNNVFDYYDSVNVDIDDEKKNLDDTLIDYLNNEVVIEELSQKKLNDSTSETDAYIKKISKKLILCNEILDSSFPKLIKSIPFSYNELDFDALSENKVDSMVKSWFLNLTISNYNRLKSRFPNQHLLLIGKHIHKFLEDFKDYDFDAMDFANLITSNKVKKDDLASLVPLIDEGEIIADKKLSALICELLSDSKYIKLSYALINSLFVNGMGSESKIKLLNRYFESLDISEVKTLVSLLSYPYNRMVVKRKRPSINLSMENRKLVENLKSINLITSYEYKKRIIKVVAKY